MRIRSSAELKAMARNRMAPKITALVGAVIIYGAILVALAIAISIVYTTNLLAQGVFESEEAVLKYITEEMNKVPTGMDLIYTYGIEIIISAILSTLTVGLYYTCLKAARKEEVKASDIFSVYKMNPDRIIIIYLVGFIIKFIFTLPSTILSYFDSSAPGELSIISAVSLLLQVIGIVIQIGITVLLSQANFIYLDKPDQSSIISIRESVMYMRRHFASYLYLYFSFLPWYLVIAVTFGVASIWVLPYMNTTFALYYMEITGENNPRFDKTV